MYVVLEGQNGSGKSTISKIVMENLKKEYRKVICTREPGGTPIGELLRGILLSNTKVEMCSTTEFLMLMASRSEIFEQIIKPNNMDSIIISDRSVLSSAIYQFIRNGAENLDTLQQVYTAFGDFPVPDVTYVLTCPKEIAKNRLNSRDSITDVKIKEIDKFETKVYKYGETESYEKFLEIASGSKYKSIFGDIKEINCNREIKHIACEITRDIISRISKGKKTIEIS